MFNNFSSSKALKWWQNKNVRPWGTCLLQTRLKFQLHSEFKIRLRFFIQAPIWHWQSFTWNWLLLAPQERLDAKAVDRVQLDDAGNVSDGRCTFLHKSSKIFLTSFGITLLGRKKQISKLQNIFKHRDSIRENLGGWFGDSSFENWEVRTPVRSPARPALD